MGTDSTELTFIRCPSCRSLVPAASPRCRMCGAALEASKKSTSTPEAQASKAGSARARQQTVQVPSQDEIPVSSKEQSEDSPSGRFKHTRKFARDVVAKQEPKDKAKSAAVVQKSSFTAEPQEEFISDDEIRGEDTDPGDPLGAFLEEVAVEAEEGTSVADSTEADSEEPGEQFSNGFHAEDEDLPAEEFAEEPEVSEIEPEPEPEEYSRPLRSRSPGKDLSAKAAAPSRTENYFRKTKQTVIKEKTDPKTADESFENDFEYEERPKSAKSLTEIQAEVQPQRSKAVSAEAKHVYQEPMKGRLLGWLVSYADPKGTAIELREGKFFVSRSSLKGSDLILDDDSISTPHALFGITGADGIKVQDLMSDRGVFIRRQGSEAYQRMLENAALQHGDWVRFGDVEFQVAVL